MRFLLLTPGQGEVRLAEGDPAVPDEHERLVEEFRRQLDQGMWAVVPSEGEDGRREATLAPDFSDVPAGAECVIFFPRAAGGSSWEAEQRAELKARSLLKSVVSGLEWDMYEDLGFIEVPGDGRCDDQYSYSYLIYPHKPVVACLPSSGKVLDEYCVKFPDGEGAKGSSLLPASDDVLAKWLSIKSNEVALLKTANLDRLGSQLDPEHVKRDLDRLAEWKHRRAAVSGSDLTANT